jgi:hypothetical protein
VFAYLMNSPPGFKHLATSLRKSLEGGEMNVRAFCLRDALPVLYLRGALLVTGSVSLVIAHMNILKAGVNDVHRALRIPDSLSLKVVNFKPNVL